MHANVGPVPDNESAEMLTAHVGERIRELLSQAAPEERVELANSLLRQLGADSIEPGPKQLTSLFPEYELRSRQLRRPSKDLQLPDVARAVLCRKRMRGDGAGHRLAWSIIRGDDRQVDHPPFPASKVR